MTSLAAMQSSVQLGDAARAGGYYGSAVTQYQAAGMMGATTVAHDIDVQSKGATASLTQRAWDMNGLLAGLNASDSAISDDADQAKKFIDQMMQWYVAANAYAAAPAAHADAITQMGQFVPTSAILPVFGPMPAPYVGPATPSPPAPHAAPAAPRAATPVGPPRPTAPLSAVAAVGPKKPSPFTLKSVLAAAGSGVGGFLLGGPIGAVAGVVLGGAGSKFLLKW